MAEDIIETEMEQDAPEKKKGGKLWLILIVVFVVLGIGGGAGYYFFGAKLFKKPVAGEEANQEKEKKKVMGPILALEPFLFNISGSQNKFAKITLGLELKDPKVLEEGKKMTLAIRDRVLGVLGAKGPDVLMDLNSRDALKKEILDSVKTLFKDASHVNAVYVTDIIIQ